VEWRLETKTSLLSTIVHNHKASKYGAGWMKLQIGLNIQVINGNKRLKV
jgi:hypothetical protein